MDIRVCGDDLLSSTFKSSDGRLCFATSSESGWSKRRTTIWKLNPSARQRWQLAGIEWSSRSPSRASFLRKEMDLDTFLSAASKTNALVLAVAWLIIGVVN